MKTLGSNKNVEKTHDNVIKKGIFTAKIIVLTVKIPKNGEKREKSVSHCFFEPFESTFFYSADI